MLSASLLLFVIQYLFWSINALRITSPSCRAYEEPRICGPACPATCDTLNTNVCCDVKCVTGCFCQDGYMLVSNVGPRRCVPIDGCPKPGILEFGNITVTVFESAKVVMIVVLRLNGSAGEIAVRWRTIEGTAKERADFVPSTGILVFPDGVTFRTITIRIIDDAIREPDEYFAVVLSDPTNKAEINPRRLDGVRVIIKDDDMRPGYVEVLNSSLTVPENFGTVLVTLFRIGGLDGVIRIQYRTIDGTARSQLDYISVKGVIIFNEGEDRKIVQITIINDDIVEPVENFQLQFFDPSPAPGVINFRQLSSRLTSVITIIDDDMRPGYIELELITITVAENIGTVNVVLVRLQGTDGQIQIKYRTIDGTARETVDYAPITGEVIFNEGETRKVISLAIIDDDLREPVENVKLQLFDPSAAPDVINFRSLTNRLETTITIIDNDMKPGYIELPNPVITVPESVGTITLNVVRVGGQDGEIRIRYREIEATASALSDYVINSGELVFRDGETLKQVVIEILNDDVREPTENFRFELFEPSAAPDVINFRGLSRRTSTIITIVDDDMKPGYLELEQVNVTVKENLGTLQVTVVRFGGTDGILQLKYRTRDGTATVQSDYQPVFGDLVFKDGESRKTISIVILNDNLKESVETFRLEIYDITPGSGTINFRALGSRLSTLITIIDDDETPGYIEMGVPSISVPENIGAVVVPVIRLGGSDGELRVPYKILDVSAVAGLDYRPILDVLVFKAGETRKTITVSIIDDQVREKVETFQIQLLDIKPQLGQVNFRLLGSRLTTVVSIIDNDAKPGLVEFERSGLTIREDVGVVEITVLRVDGTDGILLVKYKAVVGTAIAPADFTVVEGELVFQDGVDRLKISIKIVDDRIKEPDETFSILIYEPDGVQGRRLGRTTSILITIIDNDYYPGVFEFQNVRISVFENIGTLSTTIIRRDGSDGQVSLQIRTRSGTAIEGVDYNPPPQTVLFPEGVVEQRVQLQIIDDDLKEGDETFFIGLFNPTNGGVLGENKLLTVVIIDNDDPSVIRFQRRSGSFRESSGLAEIPVIRENRLDRRVSVNWKTEDLSARASEDYRGTSNGLLIFEPNERSKVIRIAIVVDTQFESSELFDIILFNPSEGAVLGIPSRYTVKLSDRRENVQPSVPSISFGIQISFRLQNIRVKESAGEVRILIARSGPVSPLTVRIKTVDGSAIGGKDYRRTSGPISFGSGDIEIIFSIRIIDDDAYEPDETFTVELFDASLGIIPLGLNVVTVTIEDDDGDFTGRRGDGSASAVVTAEPRPQPTPGSVGPYLLDKCPDHLILKTCANTCPPTCSSMFGKSPCSFDGGCIRGCFCPDGLVKESELSERCIEPSQCPQPRPPCSKCDGSHPSAGSQRGPGLLGLL